MSVLLGTGAGGLSPAVNDATGLSALRGNGSSDGDPATESPPTDVNTRFADQGVFTR